jgi:hypothetical protein
VRQTNFVSASVILECSRSPADFVGMVKLVVVGSASHSIPSRLRFPMRMPGCRDGVVSRGGTTIPRLGHGYDRPGTIPSRGRYSLFMTAGSDTVVMDENISSSVVRSWRNMGHTTIDEFGSLALHCIAKGR